MAADRSVAVRSILVGIVCASASLMFALVLPLSGPSSLLRHNPPLLEARSLLTGTTVLPERLWDTALYDGRAQNVFQPGQTFLFLAHLLAAGERALSYWRQEIFSLFVLSSALFAAALVQLSGGRVILAGALAASMMFGAPYIASLPTALNGAVYRTNHVLAIVFMSAALAVLGRWPVRRHLLLTGACVACAMVFRLQTALLLIVPLSMLMQDRDGRSWRIGARLASPAERRALASDLMRLLALPLLAVLLVAAFQAARFQNPFENGYIYIYEGRDDYLAQRAHQYGVWSLQFLPETLWRTLFAVPSIQFDGLRIARIVGDPLGNSLLFSQPVLLMAALALTAFGAARVQAFALTALAMALPVWTYHNPGFEAPGYMRYSLDYLPVWIATLAVARAYSPVRRVWEIAGVLMSAWAVYYGWSLLTLGVTKLESL